MKPYYESQDGVIYHGDAKGILSGMESGSVYCCVTSPPYWGLRNYRVPGQLGLEKTPEEYVAKMVEIFREVWRVLRDDATLWLNLGDTYAAARSYQVSDNKHPGLTAQRNLANSKPPPGLKQKDLCGIPWRVALALQSDGWYLRSDIIWHKPNPMPESVTDRPTKSHEYIFLLSKSQKYFYDADAIKEKAYNWGVRNRSNFRGGTTDPKLKHHGFTNCNNANTGRNKRSVWTVTTKPFKAAHFATFPTALIEPCILAGCPKGGAVLDPFFGAGTTGVVAYKHDRKFIGIELNQEYCEIATKRIKQERAQLKLF